MTMPVLFVGHGNPMNAIEDNDFSRAWTELGRQQPRPESILCVSAHWETDGTCVTAAQRPETIHDFSGFPAELNHLEYPAPGSPALVTNSRNTSPVWAFTCSAGQLHFHIRDKERQSGGITCRLEPGRWYHVIGVRDAAGGTLSLYVDHQRVGSRPGVAGDVNSGGSIWVGDHSNILLKACIDDVTLWKRALSAQEISALKRAALQAPTPAGVPQGISPVRQRLDRQHVLPRK